MTKLLINSKVCKNTGLILLALTALLTGILAVHAQQYITETGSKTTGNILYSDDKEVWIRFKTSGAVGMEVTQYGQPGFLTFVSHSADTITSEGQEITVIYKCRLPMGGLPFTAGLRKNGQIVQQITKQVTCSSLPLHSSSTLQELSSDVTGTVGTADTVSITARAGNANSMKVSQYGQPSSLAYVSSTAKTITADTQDIKVTYKCVAQGTNIPFSVMILDGTQVRQISKSVTCNYNPVNMPRFGEVNSVTTGSVGEFVFIRVRAINAVGASIVNYGAPGFLAFQDKSASTITGSDQEVLVRYKCAAAGSNLDFNVRLSLNGQQAGLIDKKVICLGTTSNDRLEWMGNDNSGTVGSDSDTVYITVAALDANGDRISQFGQPGYLTYVSQTARDVTSNYQTVTVKYKCTGAGINIPFSVQLVKNGKVISWVTKPVTCKSA